MRIIRLFKIYPIILVIVLALFLRLVGLGTYPPGPTNVEVAYFYNAYSIAETGKNILGQTFPFFSNFSLPPFMPVQTYLMTPIIKLFGSSLTTSRLLFALLGSGSIYLLYLLVKQILNDKRLALLSALALTISPWHFQESRIGYEAIPSLFFLLLGIVCVLFCVRKKITLFLPVVIFTFSVFSYRAHNIIFFPLMVILFWYIFPLIKISKKQIISYWVGVGIVTLMLYLAMFSFKGGYSDELIFSKLRMTTINDETEQQIKLSTAPRGITNIFINDASSLYNNVKEFYLTAFSTSFLFTSGEQSGVRSMWTRGHMFLTDIVFLILGVVFFIKRRPRRDVLFLLLLLLIGPLPPAISRPSFGMRGIFMLPFLMILLAGGWLFFINYLKKVKRPKRFLIASLVVVLYAANLSSYYFQYIFRYPIYASEWWFLGIRDSFDYIDKNIDKNQKVILGTEDFIFDALQYAYYHKTPPKSFQEELVNFKNGKEDTITIGNVVFTQKCDALSLVDKYNYNFSNFVLHDICLKPTSKPVFEIKERGSIKTIWWIYSLPTETGQNN